MQNENSINEAAQYKGKGAFDAFINLLCLITLGWMSISIGIVLFQIINKFFIPAPIDYSGSFSQNALKFNIASVVIITPIFLAVVGWLHKNYKVQNLNYQSGVHRWLTYLMLLISALTVIGRLVYQLFRFLDGDYTAAVLLRTVVILVIAGGIFGYYFYDLMRKDFSQRSAVSSAVLAAVSVLALGSVIGGFFIVDSPAKSRVLKLDGQRVNDLTELGYTIENYYNQNGSQLPSDLSQAQFSGYVDPETKQPYEYAKLGDKQYQLCATFTLAVPAVANNPYNGPRVVGGADIFNHGAGRQCFTRTVQNFDKNIPTAPAI